MGTFKNAEGKSVLLKMVTAIQENKTYLGDVDGLIGDGDHGMNMNKGFTMFGDRIADEEIGFSDGLNELGTILFNEIGGSMGPIYGTIFMEMADAGEDYEEIGTEELATMLEAGFKGAVRDCRGPGGRQDAGRYAVTICRRSEKSTG